MVEVLHYTRRDRINVIRKEGLIPKNGFVEPRFEGILPIDSYTPVIFGLFNPPNWNYNGVDNIWFGLMYHISKNPEELILLKFDLISSDNAFVVDCANYIKWLERECSFDEACKNYFEMRIPIFDYNGGFNLPEIIIYNNIPVSRLNLFERGLGNKFRKKHFWKSFF